MTPTDQRTKAGALFIAVLVLASLTGWALAAGSSIPEPPPASPGQEQRGDLALYERIADRVKAGESYYSAAVEEQEADNYPTSPPPAVRLPTVTFVSVVLGGWTPWLLRLLLGACVVGAMLRFEKIAPTKPEWISSTLLLAATVALFGHPTAIYFAEAWAVCLMVLSLLARRRGRWRLSLALGMGAVLFRELAGPYLVVMGVMAWKRNRAESLAWFAGAASFCVLYAIHWGLAGHAAATYAEVPSDPWVTFGGWPYVVDTVRFSSLLRPLPYWVSAGVVAAAILGWIARRGGYRDRALAISLAFIALFMVAGRPNTAYWGTLYLPLLLPGLAFFPRAVVEVARPVRIRARIRTGRIDGSTGTGSPTSKTGLFSSHPFHASSERHEDDATPTPPA